MNYIAVDWGSSNFRAMRVQDGNIVATVQSSAGVGRFADKAELNAVLANEMKRLGSNYSEDLPVMMCGMIGSNLGICDVGYRNLPLSIKALKSRGVQVDAELPNPTYIKPGIACRDSWDVCRGEELQILGAASRFDSEVFVAAGTHSKWVQVDKSGTEPVVTKLHTFMTGEMYKLLLDHSLVGKGLPEQEESNELFIRGIEAAKAMASEQRDIITELFKCRARYVLGQIEAKHTASYLSGLLIGHEVRSMAPRTDKAITLIGSDALLPRYRAACEMLGVACNCLTLEETVLLGFNEVFNGD